MIVTEAHSSCGCSWALFTCSCQEILIINHYPARSRGGLWLAAETEFPEVVQRLAGRWPGGAAIQDRKKLHADRGARSANF